MYLRSFTVIEDYLQMLLQLFNFAPDILFPSPAFPVAIRAAVTALTLVQSDIIFAALDFLANVITHESLIPKAAPPPKFPIYAAAIRSAVDKDGLELSGCLLSGLTGDFPEEAAVTIVSIFKTLATFWSSQLLAWIPGILQQLSPACVPDHAKSEFLNEMTRYDLLPGL